MIDSSAVSTRSAAGPMEAQLAALWDEVSKQKLTGPSGFFRRLRLQRRLSLSFCDADTIEVKAPQWKINDCSTCTENCCVGPEATVLLRLIDIARLVDLGYHDWIDTEAAEWQSEYLEERRVLRQQLRHSRIWSTFPRLKKTNVGACVALSDTGQCGLYPNWPLSCERFPYSLHGDLKDVYFSSRCDAYWIRHDVEERVQTMTAAAVAAYNERLKDLILIDLAFERLKTIGFEKYLKHA